MTQHVLAALALTFCAAAVVATTDKSAFRICGRATEMPGENGSLARGVIFQLAPLEVFTRSTSAGYFCFEDVPAGDYTISVREYVGAPTNCNQWGCWPDTPVSVVDADIARLFIVMRTLPTPTATPDLPCLGDGNGDDEVTVDELVGAVGNALRGCP